MSVILGIAASAAGEQPRTAARQPVKQAAFDRSASRKSPQTVRFGRRLPHVGDQTEQTIALEMRMTLSMLRANELFGKSQTTVRTHQRRVINANEVAAGKTTAATVHYMEATRQIIADGNATAPDSNDATGAANPPQPVQGKTYRCERKPGDDGKLIVTDETGNEPPSDELEIVAPQMEMIGRTNPLADYLSGRTIAVGEKIKLPKDIARQFFNLGERFGEVTQFDLKLENVRSEAGVPCAVFRTSVEAASNNASQMRMQVEGALVVEIDSCRAARVDLVGPIGMSETRGTYSTAYQVIGTGRLQMSVASVYRDTTR